MPDGFPCIIFSTSKAPLFTKSSSRSTDYDHPFWLKSILSESDKAIKAATKETDGAAEEPNLDLGEDWN